MLNGGVSLFYKSGLLMGCYSFISSSDFLWRYADLSCLHQMCAVLVTEAE